MTFLKLESSKMKIKQIEMQALPGLGRLLCKTNSAFIHDLETLQSIKLFDYHQHY